MERRRKLERTRSQVLSSANDPASSSNAPQIRRGLAGTNMAAYGPNLASSLNNLSNQLEEAGQFNAATSARTDIQPPPIN